MIGKTILHYKILEKLGEGGMGEVFKAQDTKLDRFVALKFLPTQLTSTGEEKERFIQEAKAASAMNHPNVCTIHSIEEHNSQLFIVMEYIDGTTLRDMKGTLSEKRILDIGIQVAEGLGAAHEKGIVHRDIKPENIMIRKDGIAQIMDFGLAKLYTSSNVSRLTKAGTTMGTMGYMSPEQVQGLDLDHRSDIFSLGVVLYELFAGESPFKGMHETAIMYEIVNVEAPPIATVKMDIDPQLDGLILECLEKEKDERCQSAKELAKNFRKIKRVSTGNRTSRMYNVNNAALKSGDHNEPANSKSSGSISIVAFNKQYDLQRIFTSPLFLWSIIGALLITVLYFTLFSKHEDQVKITSATFITGNDNVTISGGASYISHDGKSIVYLGYDSTNNAALWLRPVNSTRARLLKKLEAKYINNGGLYPFWSGDDKYIFYFYYGKLKKLNINSGTEIDICEVSRARGGAINKKGDIVFAPNYTGGLFLVSANGGKPREIVKANPSNTEESLRFPFFLPDDEHFLYTVQAKFTGSTPGDFIMVGSINSDKIDTVMQVSSNAAYANGYLFYIRQSTLMFQAFDPDNNNISGDSFTISGNINFFDSYIYAAYSVSEAGNLIFQAKSNNDVKVILTDNKGNKEKELFTTTIQNFAKFSPDENKILFDVFGDDYKNFAVWVYDIKRKISSRITFKSNLASFPAMSNDGKYFVYSSSEGKDWNLVIRNINGTGNDSIIYHSNLFAGATSWSSDGRFILFETINLKSANDIGIIDLNNNNTSRYLLNTSFNEISGNFSSNMKWIGYVSNESGKSQVYVKSFSGNDGRWQISDNGGDGLKWIDNDKAIIYTSQNEVYKIKVDGSGNNLIPGKPELLFNTSDKNLLYVSDVTKDGKTFLCIASNGNTIVPPLTYIQNWKGYINEDNK